MTLPLDTATCPDCLAEILNPEDRRFRYAFTTCANCGPRFSLMSTAPFDRANTSMADFRLCPTCQSESTDPASRRYLSHINACPDCGPRLQLVAPTALLDGLSGLMDDLARAAAILKRGHILAIKGASGFHLACDATNVEAVARLRERKGRPEKPIAVMLATLADINHICQITTEDAALLQSPSSPIVLLYRRSEAKLPAILAPNNTLLGVMLPNTPLHHLLARDLNRPIAMTSGNLPDLPVVTDNQLAHERLSEIADAFLLHNRTIQIGSDDPVWCVERGSPTDLPMPQPIRRGRGDAPYTVTLPWSSDKLIVGVGAEMKNTFCLLSGDTATISHHLGEINTLETLDYFRKSLEHYLRLSNASPQIIALDHNPGYMTTRVARLLAEGPDHALIGVQHHHAHIAACLAEHGRADRVIGIALDSGGHGSDGAVWGGEVLIASVKEFERAVHLAYLPLPGAEGGMLKPYRIAWGYLHALGGIPDLRPLSRFPADERRIVAQQIDRGNAPQTSSVGRLFDAVAALVGACTVATYGAQPAVALEQMALRADLESAQPYPFTIAGDTIQIKDLLTGLANDVKGLRSPDVIAADFHRTIAAMFTEAATQVRAQSSISTVALSGDVFQNRLLLRLLRQSLRDEGFEVLTHRSVPTNDGGLSLGQSVVALHQ